jgi:two-component system chemotaxis response regulator CheB
MISQHRHDIVAVGASAGGVEAMCQLVAFLPAGLSASIMLVLHRPAKSVSHLRDVLARHSRLPVVIAVDGEALRHGVCYVGEPTSHLTVGPDLKVRLLEDGIYGAHNIDALFFSLARYAGQRTIGVILSGTLRDGTEGLAAIKEAGGVALVQSPEEAAFADMPRNAIGFDGPVDLVAPIHLLAKEICRLTDL